MGRKNWMTYKEYIKSGVWRCNESPTGAHYWIRMLQTEKLVVGGYFMCMYCHDVKRFLAKYTDVPSKQRSNAFRVKDSRVTKI